MAAQKAPWDTRASANVKYLVGFDLGGVLGTKVPAAWYQPAKDAGFTVVRGASKAWVFVLRPGIIKFLMQFMVDFPNADLFVWSTMKRKTAASLVKAMEIYPVMLKFVLGQSACTHAPTPDDPHHYTKDLGELLASERRNPLGLTASELLFVDDSPSVPLGPTESKLIWKPFTKESVLSVVEDDDGMALLVGSVEVDYARLRFAFAGVKYNH